MMVETMQIHDGGGQRLRALRLDQIEPLCEGLGRRVTLKLFVDADHSFHVPARTGRKDAEVLGDVIDAFAALLDGVIASPGKKVSGHSEANAEPDQIFRNPPATRLLSRFRIWLRHQIIHGQFMTVISLVPPSFEGTVNFSTLRWQGVGDGAGGTELTTGGGSVGGSPNASAG
jgi:hypothetical protein